MYLSAINFPHIHLFGHLILPVSAKIVENVLDGESWMALFVIGHNVWADLKL